MTEHSRGPAYQPLTLTRLGALLTGAGESQRWRLVAEFLEEYRWEPADARPGLLTEEPAPASCRPARPTISTDEEPG